VLSCVGRGLCDGLISRPEETYRASNCVRLRNLITEEDKVNVGSSAMGRKERKKDKYHSDNKQCSVNELLLLV
jgi:hypothetical protein